MKPLSPFTLCLVLFVCLWPSIVHAKKAITPKKPALTQASSVDIPEVKRVWTSWINALRTRQNTSLKLYTYSDVLDRTASLWAEQAAVNGYISHKRLGQTAYYDYAIMQKWFASQGVVFPDSKGTTFTETIGWGVYSCSAIDCTQHLIKSIRTTFDFYLKERAKKSRPHWNSLISDRFTQIGVGIAVDEKRGRYYITTHYAVGALRMDR